MVTGLGPSIASKMPTKSRAGRAGACPGRACAPRPRLGQDHLAHRVDAVALEEHVLGAAEADALGAEGDGGLRPARGVGVGADPAAACSSAQLHELGEAEGLAGLGGFSSIRPDDLDVGSSPFVDLAGGAVDGDPVALEGLAAGLESLPLA
jgi:hypothetical protein